MSDSLWPLELQHVSLPYPSLSSRVCSDSCLLNNGVAWAQCSNDGAGDQDETVDTITTNAPISEAICHVTVFPLPCYLLNASILSIGELRLPFPRWGHWGLEKQSGAHSELVRTIQTWVGAPQRPSQRAPVCWWHHMFGWLLDVHGTCWVSIINYPELISVLVWWWGPMISLEDPTYIKRSQSLHVTRWPRGDHGKHH